MSEFLKKYEKVRGKQHVQKLQREGYIAAQIKTDRQRKKMSQQKVADLIRVPKSTIGRIEAGITSPRLDTLIKIAEALDTEFVIGETKENDKNLYIQT